MSNKSERQSQMLKEFYGAQEKEYVLSLEIELDKHDSKIIYEPVWQMYRNNELNDTALVEKNTLSDCVGYKKLRVAFSLTVDDNKIRRIAKYASSKYQCQYILAENQITFFDF